MSADARDACPRCLGTGAILLPLGKANDTARVRCFECKGTGRA